MESLRRVKPLFLWWDEDFLFPTSSLNTHDMGTGRVLFQVGFTGSDSIWVMEPARINIAAWSRWIDHVTYTRKGQVERVLETKNLVFLSVTWLFNRVGRMITGFDKPIISRHDKLCFASDFILWSFAFFEITPGYHEKVWTDTVTGTASCGSPAPIFCIISALKIVMPLRDWTYKSISILLFSRISSFFFSYHDLACAKSWS